MRTGTRRWTVYTGAPPRLAPTVWKRKVYVGADDGKVYCLSAKDGSVVWTLRAAPTDERVLGQGRLMSVWPVRTGVLVDQGVAYFGAGLFPGEGLYLYAVDAETGKVLWKKRGFSKANFLYADGRMIVLDEDGKFALTTPMKKSLKVHDTVTLCKRNAWTVPTLVETRLYVRDRKQIMALDLSEAANYH